MERETLVTIFEPQARISDSDSVVFYAVALADYSSGCFDDTAKIRTLAESGDIAAERFVERVKVIDLESYKNCDGVTDLVEK